MPLDPTDEELARDWTLTPADLVEVHRCRGDDKRHSFALQLCTLRRYGCFLADDYSKVPVRIVNHVGRQLGLPPMLFAAPPSRAATDVEHERRIREHLGYQSYDQSAEAALETWIGEQAAGGLLVESLVIVAEKYLRERRIVLPARPRLERLATAAAVEATEAALVRISGRLSVDLRTRMDSLLDSKEQNRSVLFQLKQYPPEPRPDSINVYLDRAKVLRDLDAGGIDFTGTRPEVVIHLAELARRYDVADLKRFLPAKRYALLACFLAEANKTVLDHLVEMHHVFLTGLHRRAMHAYEARHRSLRQNASRNLRVVLDALEALLDTNRSAGEVTGNLDVPAIRAAMAGCREFQTVAERRGLEELRARHHHLKRYLPKFLRLPFQGAPGNEPLLEALTYARKLHVGELAALGADAPTAFASGIWCQAVLPRDGNAPDLRSWELALAFAIRDALRSGDLYLAESRHHVSFWNLVQTSEQWAERRASAYIELSLPTEPEHLLDRLRTELEQSARQLSSGLESNPFARIEAGELMLSRRDALEIPAAVRELRRVIESHLPRTRIEDLLVAVDGRCGFTRELVPVGGYTPRLENRYPTLLAALVAHGTNLGIATMAQSTKGITVDMLHDASRWFLSPGPLKAANRVLIDYHHQLELAGVWGDGTASSSDGQRFGVHESSLLAGFYPRYFGFYERAITVYTHVSDQYSVFAAQAISCSPREAIYVLDGLLENETALRPREHYTDTHGFTEQLFGLCYLLGFSFMPRLKDLADQQLYKLDRNAAYGKVDVLFRGTIDTGLLQEQWDALARVAASLRQRTAPAHVVLDRLAASAPSDRLAKALTMLGRAVKTTYILRYLHDSALRDRVHLQLNRGESRHELARRLFFANQGAFRTGDYEEIMNKVSALSVLSNAVLVWNTVRYADIIKGLQNPSGNPVESRDLERISPLAHAHVIPSGTYHFDQAAEAA
jgi:TnpA family transposase